jgi:thiol peroxidase
MATIKCGTEEMVTIGEVPAIGTISPDFTVCNSDFVLFNLTEDYKNQHVVLFVIPSLDTATCVECLNHLSQIEKDKKMNYLVITSDTPFALKRLSASFPFSFEYICSDMVLKEFGQQYNVRIGSGPLTSLLARAVFVLDHEHKIAHVDLSDDIAVPINYELLETKIDEVMQQQIEHSKV